MACYVMLCYVTMCYVMLCYVMLYYVMSCCDMLCYGGPREGAPGGSPRGSGAHRCTRRWPARVDNLNTCM